MKLSAVLTAVAFIAVAQTGCGSTPPTPAPDLDLLTSEPQAPRALPHETCEEFSNGWDRHRCKMFWGLERS